MKTKSENEFVISVQEVTARQEVLQTGQIGKGLLEQVMNSITALRIYSSITILQVPLFNHTVLLWTLLVNRLSIIKGGLSIS